MMKKWSILLVLCLAVTGLCGCNAAPTETPESQDVTNEQSTPSFEDLIWQTEPEGPSLEVTVRWENSEEMKAFAAGVIARQPVTYEKVKDSNGVKETWRVDYQVDSATLDIDVVMPDGTNEKLHYDDVKLDIVPIAAPFYDEESGGVDSSSFMMAMMQWGMYDWYVQNPVVFPNAVYILTATTTDGTYIVDYYLDEATVSYIEELLAAQQQSGETQP